VISTVTTKIAVTAAGLVLAGAAVAAAVDAPPDAADKGLTTAEEHTGFPVPVRPGGSTDDDQVGEDEVIGEDDAVVEDEIDLDEVEGVEDDSEDEADDGEPVDNHGAAVSAVAKDHTLTGREHGQAVSEVARSDAGKPAHGDDEDDDGDERGAGNGKAKGHGRP
jgi:hypothetical protein